MPTPRRECGKKTSDFGLPVAGYWLLEKGIAALFDFINRLNTSLIEYPASSIQYPASWSIAGAAKK